MERKIDRFDKYMKAKELNDNKVTVQLGLAVGTLGKSRKENRDLSEKNIELILNFYKDLNNIWLITGEGDMLNNTIQDLPKKSLTSGVPYYNVDFMAGFDVMINDKTIIPEFLVNFQPYNNATCWCNVTGHSMEPEINNGDVIALKKIDDISFLPLGEIYAIVTTNDMRTIKRLGKGDTPDHYTLIPANKSPEYSAQQIPIKMIRFVYQVLGCAKRF